MNAHTPNTPTLPELIGANLPDPILDATRWLLWRSEDRKKVPYYADGARREGRLDTPADVARLVGFEGASDAYLVGAYTGLGFATVGGSGIGGFDLDHCLDPNGKLKKDHAGFDLVRRAKALGAYIEISPSGEGLRIFGGCNETQSYSVDGVEYWGARRYLTVTGNVWANPKGWTGLTDLRSSLGTRKKAKGERDDDDGPLITRQTLDHLRSALEAIPSDERDRWVRIGHALNTIGDKGKALWLEWSARSDKFDPADAERVWDSMEPNDIHFRSVFVEAQEDWSWQNSLKRKAGGDAETGGLPIEWGEQIEPRLNAQWLVKRTLPEVGLALIFGHPGCGKTFLALDMAGHIAMGREWHGLPVRKGTVVYVCAEGQNGARNRIAAFRRHHDADGSFPLAMIPCSIDLHNPRADRARLADAVRRAAEHYGEAPVLIIIDTISKTLGGGKENTDDLATYVSNCGWLSSEFGCCVMPIHHRPKDQDSTDPRGHGSLKGGLDTVILVEGGPIKRARITKQRDDEERDLMNFRLKVHQLGQDDDGDPVTSCTIEQVDAAPLPTNPVDRAVARLSDGVRLIYDQLLELIDAEPMAVPTEIPDDQIDRERVEAVASLETWRDNSISAAGTEAGRGRDTGRRAFNRALGMLRTRNIVRVWDEWAWLPHGETGTEVGQ